MNAQLRGPSYPTVEHTFGKRRSAGHVSIVSVSTATASIALRSTTVSTPGVFQPVVAAVPIELALHLSQRVIESYGGRLGVEAAMAGRTYRLTLPTEPRMLR